MKRIVLLASLVIGAAALAGILGADGAGARPAATPSTDTVSVTGNGSASATPDTAQIQAGVQSEAETAKGALAANASEMSKVIAALRAAGAKNITTQYVNLSPRTDQQGKPNGFTASNVVSAATTLEKAGGLIDAVVDAGANTVYGPTLTTSGARTLYKQALKAAVADARDRAEILAAATGRKVGRVVSMSESGGGAPSPVAYAKAAGADSTQIVSGEQEITASVSITFELK